jgi:hypothetical protein
LKGKNKYLRLYYNNTPIKFSGRHNNLFLLEYYGEFIRGDVIIVKEDIENMNESFHQKVCRKEKLYNAIKCDHCDDNIIHFSVGKWKSVEGQCKVASCSSSQKSNHTHKLCIYCFDERVELKLIPLIQNELVP